MSGDNYRSIDEQSIDEPLPPYSTTYGDDRGVLGDEKSKETFTARIVRSLTHNSTAQRVGPVITSSAQSTSQFLQSRAWPAIKKFRFSKRQSYAFLLLLSLGILPFFIIGRGFALGNRWFYNSFATKIVSCGDGFGEAQNSTIDGIEALFVLDATTGAFTFSQAKSIDVAWDILVGRGAQFLAWWVSYEVFTDALLRLIERHPAPYEMFMRMGIEGPGIASGWTILVELFKSRSKRTWALFFFMLISTLYVLSIPAFLSAMTGYDSRTVAWVSVNGNEDNIVPASFFTSGNYITGTINSTFEQPTCEANDQIRHWYDIESAMEEECPCQLPNGTVMSYYTFQSRILSSSYSYYEQNITYRDCRFNYTGQNATYDVSYPYELKGNCNDTFRVTLGNESYSIWDLHYESGYCWDNRGYDLFDLRDTTRCLPDTAHPSYQWGFSTMLLAIFFITHLIWSLAMYIVWQDAQFNSKLVKGGFRVTPLKAAFALTDAAKRKTALEEGELLRKSRRELHRELYGTRKKKGAEIDKEIFWEDSMELRKRRSTMDEREV